MKKTILMIGNTSWGMFRFRGDLMQKLISQGHRVVVVAPLDNYSTEIEKLGGKFVDVSVDRKGTNPFKDLLYLIRLIRIYLNEKPEVVFTYTIKPILYGIIAAWLAQVPQRIAVTTGLGNTFNSNNLINKITKILYRISLTFASEVWFLNRDDAATFIDHKLVTQNKVFLLPGEGVNLDYYLPARHNGTWTFTLMSRMLWDKGVGIFVEAAQELKERYPLVNFWLVGPVDEGNPEGIELSQLEEWNNQGLIKYLGVTDDVREVLKQTTCLIHPTYYKEGLPRVLMEACSMEVPCITTNIPGCREVVVDGLNGILVPPNNSRALTQAIINFMELSEEARNAFSTQGRIRMRDNFSMEKINSIYLSKIL